MKHPKFNEVKILVQNNINVLLMGEAGTGKTTLLRQVAEDLDLDFYSITGTRQTTLNSLLGFISINGTYIESQFRKAVENGGMFLISEIDGMDPNVLLALNTLENGFMAFPDKVVTPHKDFRLVADANPQDQHQIYTGRSKLDAATISRFDVIEIPIDPELELSLTSSDVIEDITIMRNVIEEYRYPKVISMRDSIRLFKRKKLGLDKDYYKVLLGSEDIHEAYRTSKKTIEDAKPKPIEECTTIDKLWDSLPLESNTDNANDLTGKLLEIAEHVAKHYLLTENIQEEYINDGWKINSAPSIEDPYNEYVKVSRTGYTTVYTFNKEELKQ